MAAQRFVLGLIDNAHAATAELLDDAVVRDGLSDHWSRILRARNWQVNESRGVDGASKTAGRDRLVAAPHPRFSSEDTRVGCVNMSALD
jgi:hypothetical protein